MSADKERASANYPSAYEVDVALRDGSSLHIRPVTAEDRPAIDAFLGGLSPDSISFRFFGAINLDWVAEWATDVDYSDRYALIATTGPEQTIVGHGAYVRIDQTRAEVAFLISDAWQGRGIATIMLAAPGCGRRRTRHLRVHSPACCPRNHRMLEVFRDSGFSLKRHTKDEVVEIELPTSLSARARERVEQREQTAAIAARRELPEAASRSR